MPNTHIRGIVSMLAAVAVFSVMDAAMKQLGQSYSPIQVTSLRGCASLPFVLLAIAWTRSWRELKPVRWQLHLARGLLSVTMLCLFIYSVKTLSLSSAYAIFLCGPLLVTALSVPILKEPVELKRWIAIAIGLIGVIVMIRPTATDAVTLGALAAFAAAICYALAAIMIRVVARTETTLSMSLSFLIVIAAAATAIAWPDWKPVQSEHWILIAVLGLSGAAGQYFIVEAFRHAPAAVVAPFDYTALVWGALLDWIVWHTMPNSRMMTGGAVVVATGLYLIYCEHARQREETRSAGLRPD